MLCFSACNEASRLFKIHKNCRLNSGWPLDGAKTPPAQTHSALNPAALTFLEQLRFISLTARSCYPSQTELTLLKEDCKRKQTNKKKLTVPQSWNYVRLSGSESSCSGSLADGKLWVRPGGRATFIDFQVRCLRVTSSAQFRVFWLLDCASGELWYQPTACFRFGAVQGVSYRGGYGNSIKNMFVVFAVCNGE